MTSTSFQAGEKMFQFDDGMDPLGVALRRTIQMRCRGPLSQPTSLTAASISVAVMVWNVVFCTLAGYGLAKFRFPGDKLVLLAIL